MPIDSKLYEFSQENVDKAPASAGVYALYNGGSLIYIGRAKGETTSIRTRLQSHFSGRDGKCTQSATHYKREICSNPVNREKELLEEFHTNSGKLPRCNEVMP